MKYHVKSLSLAEKGRKRIEWASRFMPVLKKIRERFEKEKPLEGKRIAACLHVTTETANLMITLKAGGAQIRLSASNPLSTQDDVAASLVEDYGIPVFAIKGEDRDTYYSHLNSVLDIEPHLTMDDGADLISTLHSQRRALLKNVLGGTEETTTGVIRLKNMALQNKLMYPVIAVNDSMTKFLFDNRYGTGQSTIDGILRATNFFFPGSVVVVCGFGWCGRGIAFRARGMSAEVIVCEVDPVKALEARMEGFRVMPLEEAAELGDLFITATGNKNVIDKHHITKMKDGAVLCNAGHFDVEINKEAMESMAQDVEVIRNNVKKYKINGKNLFLLADGRLVNLSSAEGHPAMVMDMSFSNQALAAEFIVKNYKNLEKKVYKIPDEIDYRIAMMKLETMNIKIDTLTEEQKKYLSSWEIGT